MHRALPGEVQGAGVIFNSAWLGAEQGWGREELPKEGDICYAKETSQQGLGTMIEAQRGEVTCLR